MIGLHSMPDDKLNCASSSDNTAVIHGIAAMNAALLLAMLSVFPGLFDSTLTSRLAVYPVCALLVLFAGRKHIPVPAAITAALLTILPLIGLLMASIPIQGILPAVKWISFGLMIAGAAGFARSIGSRSIWISLMTASVITAVIEILVRGDSIWGNTNRPGALLAVGFVTAVTGAGFRKAWIRIPAAVLTGTALVLTNFVLAWIAVILALLWFSLNLRKKLHPGIFIGVLLAGQIVVTAAPDITRSIAPSLEIRCRTWQAGTGQLMRNLPMGTGTGQSRLTLMQDAGEKVQILAGDPEKRIDHLHSDILTPVVEWGLGGLLLICLAGWLILRKKHFTNIEGALLFCILPFMAADLPLATPLGALPVALCLGVILSRPSEDRTIRIPLPVLLVLLAAALFWSVIIIKGYSLLERGRVLGLSGNGSAGSAAETLERASSLIPFEERTWLFLAQAYLDDGNILAAGNAAGKFNSIYPSYWKGWTLQALTETASGRTQDAADSYLNALMVAPVTLPERSILALNAAAFPPADVKSLVMIGKAICEFAYPTAEETAEMAVSVAGRLVTIAEVLPESERALARRMLLIARGTLLSIQGSGGINASELEAVLSRIRDLAYVIDSDWPNSDLQ
ncbi:MAG: hypothetical protein KAR44_06340 [Candidatus Aegiribacteria sp.]|nr:hypothetical protein [Candidatus Aegiribacteria sp.]